MKTLFILMIISLSLSAFANQKAFTWDGKYDHISCGSAEECKSVAGKLNHQGRWLDSMPYMANACIKGGYFCSMVGMLLTKKSKTEAYEWYKIACDKGNSPKTCFDALIYMVDNDPLQAKELYKKICIDSQDHYCEFGMSEKAISERKMILAACKDGHHVACNVAAQYKK